MGGGPDIAVVLHPRRDPGPVLDTIGGWAVAHSVVPGADEAIRLTLQEDSDRYQRRNQVKLSLLDLPFLPEELRELAPPGGARRLLDPPLRQFGER